MKKISLGFICLIFFQFSYSQLNFLNNYISDESQSIGGVSDVFSADLDGDGDMDILSGSYYGNRIAWQENIDGLGNYGNVNIITENADGQNFLFAADIDLDGDTDIVYSSSTLSIVAWHENLDGHGNFGDQILIDTNDTVYDVFISDINGDSYPDIVATQYNKTVWYQNLDGDGTFGTENIIANNSYTGGKTLHVSDLDNDGDMDIISNSSQDDTYIKVFWFENLNGLGDFGSENLIYNFSPEPNYSIHCAVFSGDMDNDGDNDVVFSTNDQVHWFENTDGQGTFGTDHLLFDQYIRNKVKDLELHDIDNDNDLDVVFVTSKWQDPDEIWWLENIDQQGGFGNHKVSNDTNDGITSITISDIDGDGNKDIVSSSTDQFNISWYKKVDAQATFEEEKSISRYWYSPNSVSLVDVDSDNDLDILSQIDDAVVWFENTDGVGSMEYQKVIPVSSGVSELRSADINGDGHLDIITVHATKIYWMENNGLGGFGAQIPIELNANNWIIPFVGDFDNDNDIDIIAVRNINDGAGVLAVYENTDGLGTFGTENIIRNLGSNGISSVVTTDLDGDSINDFVFSVNDISNNNNGKIGWLKGTGSGVFDLTIRTISSDESTEVLAVDLDGDGDKDILSGAYENDKITWFENTDGLGSFGNELIIYQSNNLNGTRDVHASDMDNDGDLDVLFTSRYGNSNVSWFENIDGLGSFSSLNTISNIAPGAQSIDVGDLDLDGNQDVIFTTIEDNHVISWAKNSGLLFNRINGNVTLDIDNNNCDSSDPMMSNLMVVTDNGNETLGTFTNSNGYYQLFPSSIGTYTTTISPPNYYSSNPTSADSFFTDLSNIEVVDFCVEPSQSINDLNITISPIDLARPGFDTKYVITYHNVGTTQLSGDINFQFDDSKLNFLSASEVIDSQTSNELTFNYTNLNPFESKSIIVEFNVFTIPQVNLGDVLVFTAIINPVNGDETVDDNTFQLNQTVIGSYDPNDITVLEGESITTFEIDNYLHYVIRFQNTGTAQAINVVVKNDLDPKLDWTTLQIETMSHNNYVEIKNGNQVSFVFDNIYLPDSTNDEPNSHGYIAYKIKPISSIAVGDVISNIANIYFDYNSAIITNTVYTEVIQDTDTDSDGIYDSQDNCINAANPNQEDIDNDGVGDICDDDDDNDGVLDINDNCPLIDNPNQEDLDNDGLGDICDDDDDNDGILDIHDDCPLYSGASSNNGCPLELPYNNFSIETLSETCVNQNNAQIIIEATENYNYEVTLTLNGNQVTLVTNTFNTSLTIDGLSSGAYILCINIPTENYTQCFNLGVTEPANLVGLSNSNDNNNRYSLSLTGGILYNIDFNNEHFVLSAINDSTPIVFEKQFSREVNTIRVTTNKDCQGQFEETITLDNFKKIILYPNPANNNVYMSVISDKEQGVVTISDVSGKIIWTKNIQFPLSNYNINTDKFSSGIYFIQLVSPSLNIRKQFIKN